MLGVGHRRRSSADAASPALGGLSLGFDDPSAFDLSAMDLTGLSDEDDEDIEEENSPSLYRQA